MTLKIKKEIIFTAKKLVDIGFNLGAEGNLSIRTNTDIYITPSGIDAYNLNDKQICVLDQTGKLESKNKPSSETNLHMMLYKKRKDINAIVHTHSTWASILSCLRIKIPSFHYMIAEFGGNEIPCAKYSTFGTLELAQNVTKALGNKKGCLISNHGQITVGKNLEEAFYLSKSMEKLSKQFYFCNLSKNTKLLDKLEMDKVIKLFKTYKVKH